MTFTPQTDQDPPFLPSMHVLTEALSRVERLGMGWEESRDTVRWLSLVQSSYCHVGEQLIVGSRIWLQWMERIGS